MTVVLIPRNIGFSSVNMLVALPLRRTIPHRSLPPHLRPGLGPGDFGKIMRRSLPEVLRQSLRVSNVII
jgi:hypothetical protein